MRDNFEKIVGFIQQDESNGVEYVFCRACSDREKVAEDKDKFISQDEAKRDFYFCDVCEVRLL
jgi:hypothetical protein